MATTPPPPPQEARTPSPRRRNTVSQAPTDWSFAPFTPSRGAPQQTGYEDVVRLLDTVASATLEEKSLTDTYEGRIRELEAENAELLKENEDLLRLLHRSDTDTATATDLPPDTQTSRALSAVRALQETLVRERDSFGVREAGLTARVFGLERAVTDSLRDLLTERRVREEVEWQVWPRGREREKCRACADREEHGDEQGEEGRRAREKLVRELEEKIRTANLEITHLTSTLRTHTLLSTHTRDTAAELDLLREGLKRIEQVALMYSPLDDSTGLLEAIERWKGEWVECRVRGKRRGAKEERWAGAAAGGVRGVGG